MKLRHLIFPQHPFKLLWRPLKLLLEALLPCLVGGLIFLVYTPSGLALGVYVLQDLTHGELRVTGAHGSLRGPLQIDEFIYDTPVMTLRIEHAALDWNTYALLRARLDVGSVQAQRVQLTLKRHPHTTPEKPALTHLPLALHVAQLQAQDFELYPQDSSRPVLFRNIRLAANWRYDILDVHAVHADYAPLGPLDAALRLQLQPHGLEILESHWRAPAQAQAQGSIGYDNHMKLRVDFAQLQWPFSGDALVAGSAGIATAAGTWQHYNWTLRGQVRGNFQPQPIDAGLVAHGRGTLHGLEVQQAELRGKGGTLRAQAQLAWLPAFALSLQGEASGVSPAIEWNEWAGNIAGKFQLDLQHADDGVRAQFSASLADSTLRDYRFALDTRGSYAAHVLDFAQLDVQSGASRISVHGRATPPFDLAATIDSPDLANLLPQLSGSGQAQLAFAGTLAEPHLSGHVQLAHAQYGTFRLDQATLDADLSPRLPSRIDLAAKNLIAGLLMPSVQLHGQGTAAAHQLQLKAVTQAGSLDLALRGALDTKALHWQGQVYESHGQPLRLSPWTLEEAAPLEIYRGYVQLDPVCWRSSAARACTQFALRGSNARLAFRLQDWAFAYFEPFLPPQWTLGGTASGSGLLVYEQGRLRSARADLDSAGGALNVSRHPALTFAASSLRISDEDAGTKAQLHMPLANGGIELKATLAPAAADGTRALSGHVAADVGDLTPLRLLSPQLESIDGRLHGDFDLAGTAADPLAQGVLQLIDGRVRLATPGLDVTGLQASLRGDSSSRLINVSASAQSGGGSLALSGTINPRGAQERVDLHLSGQEFQVLNTPQMRVWASPELDFHAGADHVQLRGEVVVPRAEIKAKSFSQGVAPSRDQVILGPDAQAPPEVTFKTDAQVRLTLGDAVSFEGFGLKALLRGGIDVIDQPGRPTQGRGEISLAEGRYKAYGQDLTIDSGRLLFEGGLITQPGIDVRAVRNNTGDVTVGVLVRGTLAAPQLSLFS
ncbi:MAG TPA: translocation/assembly module TamB domain-containing protein, partial [Nevskiaceae bacterium]|nr:translocation/assembly module TamB domain-containing protein [Nevskiaceae bacterium]